MQNKKDFAEIAKGYFENPKNKDVDKIYITADSNIFRLQHYADDWKNHLNDREVQVFQREKEEVLPINGDINDEITSDITSDPNSERDALVKEHIELFDTKPAANISIEKLKGKIAAKQAELAANTEKIEIEGTQEGTAEDNENQ